MRKAAVLRLLALAAVVSGCAGTAYIPSTYGSYNGANNFPRAQPHAGVDFGAEYGSPALAAADGRVIQVSRRKTGCGYGVLMVHGAFARYTVYCHLEEISVRAGDEVERGDTIGFVGTTGNSAGVPHVHLELCTYPCPYGHADGHLRGTEDPLASEAGCFDPKKQYPSGRLVLTYPVKC